MSVVKTGYGSKITSTSSLKSGEFDFDKLDSPECAFFPELMLSHQHYETAVSVSGDIRTGVLETINQATDQIKANRVKVAQEINAFIDQKAAETTEHDQNKMAAVLEAIKTVLPKEDQIKDPLLKGALPQITSINMPELEFDHVDTTEPEIGSFEMLYMAKNYEVEQEEVVNLTDQSNIENGDGEGS